jgi:hypothetical protein
MLPFCRLRSLCTLPHCWSSMPPCFQGLILGLLTASLLLAIVISLWLTSSHKTPTTNSMTIQISTGIFFFSLSDLQKTDKFLIKSICSDCLPYTQIEQYDTEEVFRGPDPVYFYRIQKS